MALNSPIFYLLNRKSIFAFLNLLKPRFHNAYLLRGGLLTTALSFFLALILILGASDDLLAWVSVIFPPENTVSGPRIILGDVATVAPDSDSDQNLSQIVSQADLGPAPAPGAKLIFRKRQLENRLSSSGLPLSDIRWLIPEEIRLTGVGQSADSDLLKKIITDYLSRSEPYRSGRFELINLSFASPPTLNHGKVEYRFSPQRSSNPAHLTGVIYFSVDGKEAARLRVTAQIDLRMPSLVAVRDLPRGHVISEEDISESEVNFSQIKGALKEASQAVGQTLKTTVRAGAPIRERDLTSVSMVKKGETVTIVAQGGGLKITALGQAKQDGSIGQTIGVLNQDSKKTISAKVIGPGMVEVIF
jgi:flagella basal body P-ring formation protein FlgA